MKIKGEFVLRKIAGDNILVPVGISSMEINGLITMDEVGVFIWKEIEDGKNDKQILQDILDKYEVEESEAQKDLEEFLEKLEQSGLIEM